MHRIGQKRNSSSRRSCEELEELKKLCCTEAERAKIDEHSIQDSREFYDFETASGSGLSHVLSQPLSIPSPRGMLTRDSCLHGTHLAYQQPSLEIPEILHQHNASPCL